MELKSKTNGQRALCLHRNSGGSFAEKHSYRGAGYSETPFMLIGTDALMFLEAHIVCVCVCVCVCARARACFFLVNIR
jgi:hypothetical protein